MILISHRGNIDGKIPSFENNPEYVDEAITAGYDVEIDVWGIDGELFLGHDNPQYPIGWDWLKERSSNLWIHCKNIDALLYLTDIDYSLELFNYFWHENDTVTLTSENWIWAFPGKQPINGSIAVMPEIYNDDVSEAAGVCSDYIQNYKK
jgi:hypothetical protein